MRKTRIRHSTDRTALSARLSLADDPTADSSLMVLPGSLFQKISPTKSLIADSCPCFDHNTTMFHPQLRQIRGKPLRKKLKRHAFHGNDSRHGRLRSGISSDQDARLFFLIRNLQHVHCRCGLRSQVGPASLSDGISLCHDPGRNADSNFDMGGAHARALSLLFQSATLSEILIDFRVPHS